MTEEDKKLLNTFEARLRHFMYLHDELKHENAQLKQLLTEKNEEVRRLDYRSGSQDEVLVPAGTLTYSYDEETKTTFTYALQEDLKMEENMSVTVPWNGEASIYHNYPPKEVEKNPNLKR